MEGGGKNGSTGSRDRSISDGSRERSAISSSGCTPTCACLVATERRIFGFPRGRRRNASRERRRRGRERRGQTRLMVMVASQCLSGRRPSRYISTSWSTCARSLSLSLFLSLLSFFLSIFLSRSVARSLFHPRGFGSRDRACPCMSLLPLEPFTFEEESIESGDGFFDSLFLFRSPSSLPPSRSPPPPPISFSPRSDLCRLRISLPPALLYHRNRQRSSLPSSAIPFFPYFFSLSLTIERSSIGERESSLLSRVFVRRFAEKKGRKEGKRKGRKEKEGARLDRIGIRIFFGYIIIPYPGTALRLGEKKDRERRGRGIFGSIPLLVQ